MLASRSALLVLCAAVATGCAGVQRPWSGKGYCEIGADASGHEAWVRLLVRGYDPESRRVTTPAIDCTDAQIRWEAPATACFDHALTTTLLPARPLAESDVFVSRIDERFSLAWVVTNRFASGDGLGPVAVVERSGGRMMVRAIGVLRAYTDRVSLRMERIGKTPVLVAEGQLCTSKDPESCLRAARIMPLRGDRFSQEPLFSDAGVCVSPAWFELARRDDEPLPTGWTRQNQLSASLVFGPEALRVEELLLVNDLDPRQPTSQPRPFRRAHGERTVRAEPARLVADGQSVWKQVVNGR